MDLATGARSVADMRLTSRIWEDATCPPPGIALVIYGNGNENKKRRRIGFRTVRNLSWIYEIAETNNG
ncbi:hypothetical protein PanWU01x14_188210 [Parasponia andersonii]|uniref:Uncharacterized protein n=1 Tax=Parasponia andersonii TaxID=3476 RepID=A0A2P5C3A5_PARAD|nr:hypothetical protein PanWU01x14_188210 [Parasponia andersonii]